MGLTGSPSLKKMCIRDRRITVKGNGHGFGISLYTADRMIREGMSWEEVIQKFYENAECITLF